VELGGCQHREDRGPARPAVLDSVPRRSPRWPVPGGASGRHRSHRRTGQAMAAHSERVGSTTWTSPHQKARSPSGTRRKTGKRDTGGHLGSLRPRAGSLLGGVARPWGAPAPSESGRRWRWGPGVAGPYHHHAACTTRTGWAILPILRRDGGPGHCVGDVGRGERGRRVGTSRRAMGVVSPSVSVRPSVTLGSGARSSGGLSRFGMGSLTPAVRAMLALGSWGGHLLADCLSRWRPPPPGAPELLLP